MSEQNRTPGRVDEKAAPIDGIESKSQTQSYDQSMDEGGATTTSDRHRVPGYVEGPSEPIENDLNAILPDTKLDFASKEHGLWKYVLFLFISTILIWLVFVAASAITEIWKQSIWLALPLVVIGFAFLSVLVLAMRREYKALNAVDVLEERREKIRAAIESDSLKEIKEILEPTLKNLRKRYPGLVAEFEEAAKNRYSASEYLKQLDNIVLTQLDQEVSNLTNRSAFTTGVAVTIVPHPALDAAVALWRAVTLVRNIGYIYGLEPTGLSSLRLLRHTITTAIIAAGADMAADAVVDGVSEGAANLILPKVGEGAVMAWRIYRLGKYTQKLCRPPIN